MELEQAIAFLKKTIKESCIPGQNHIDPALLSAEEQKVYQNAMVAVTTAISRGEMTREEFDQKVGLGK